jgi:hypothetical protein
MNTPRITRLGLTALVAAILAATLLAAALPYSARAQNEDVACRTTHIVREGDTKPRIAFTYDLRWREIAAANDMNLEETPAVGDRLCIPFADEDDDSDTNDNGNTNSQTLVVFPEGERSAVIQVSITGGRITVHTDNFNNDHNYLVKVRPSDVGVGGWVKLGTIGVDEDESENFSFNVPNALDDEAFLSVCLKDQASDELVCRAVVNP